MICEKCRHQAECIEQRGRCTSFQTWKQWRKERKQQIEMLNQKYGSSVPGRTDTLKLPEAGQSDRSGETHQSDPDQLQGQATGAGQESAKAGRHKEKQRKKRADQNGLDG